MGNIKRIQILIPRVVQPLLSRKYKISFYIDHRTS